MRNEIWWEDTGAILNGKKIKQGDRERERDRNSSKPIYMYIYRYGLVVGGPDAYSFLQE